MQTLTILLEAGNDGGLSMLIMLVLMFAIMYFFMIRPQQKKQKEIQNFRNAIARGTEIITAGGVYGIVRDIDEVNNVLVVEVARDVRVRVDRNSVFATGSDARADQASGYSK